MQHQIAKQIILQPVEALIPYARNSRTHSDEQVAQIAASIREFGFTNPVLVDDEGGIVAGHGRVMAARQIGMTAVPTINVGWLSEQQRRAYVIADNQLAMNAGWDESVLAQEVAWLQDHQFNTDLLGFNADYLDGLLAEEAHICSAGCDRHFESEEVLLNGGSAQEDLWGGGIDLETKVIDFNSFINIRPTQNNMSNEIQSEELRKKYKELTKIFFKEIYE